MGKHGGRVLVGVTIIAVLTGGAWVVMSPPLRDESDAIEILTTTDYRAPVPPADDVLVDDRIEDKVPKFDPEVVDRRPLGDWQVNASAAVIGLDTPMLRPDRDEALLRLRPSYKAAADAAPKEFTLLPSVNMIDGKAKQFDDGLMAAIDLAWYRGLDKALAGHVDLIRRLLDKVGPASPAAPYLAAGLALAGDDRPVGDLARKAEWLSGFETDPARSKPIAFYTWSKPLSDCFRFLRYFQAPIPAGDRAVVTALAGALKADTGLLADYEKALAFAAKLSNPTTGLTVADVARGRAKADADRSISLYPESTSREAELFERLFPTGLPADVDLIRELIRKIRSGEVSLVPRPESGWYDYQAYALETLLLPDRGEEADHLRLTREYKKRMLEAFKALMTKRKETHIRGAKTAESAMAMMPAEVAPRLRLEPCPSYYVRTARAYAFLANVLDAQIGPEALKRLHGLREGGERGPDLHAELRSIRDLFYGFYLLSAEDLGMTPRLLDGETIDRAACEKAAADWLAKALDDPDLAVDTRVSVPVYLDPVNRRSRLWATVGVRLARLDATYERGPKLRPREGDRTWVDVEPRRLGAMHYLIAVDEFAEIELPGVRTLTRAELQAACDAETTSERIVARLKRGH